VETSRLRLRVSPGAKRPEIVGRHGDSVKIVEVAGISPAQTEALLASAGRKDIR